MNPDHSVGADHHDLFDNEDETELWGRINSDYAEKALTAPSSCGAGQRTSSMKMCLNDDGNWGQVIGCAKSDRKRPALFLDRDGVIVEEIDYLHRSEDVRLIEGTAELIRSAHDQEWYVAIVTNQAGVGRGYYDWSAFAEVQHVLLTQLEALGAYVDIVLACAHHPTEGMGRWRTAHPWRKPEPGMLYEAARRLPIDLSRSWIVGDTLSDLEAGRRAGLTGGVHVLTGHGARDRDAVRNLRGQAYRVRLADSIADVEAILAEAAAWAARSAGFSDTPPATTGSAGS